MLVRLDLESGPELLQEFVVLGAHRRLLYLKSYTW
jgi:hypothetical protein